MNRVITTLFSLMLSLSFVTIGSAGHADVYDNTLTEQHKIEILVHSIGNPDLTFIRNGDEYSAAVAKSHVKKKLDYAGSRIKTARQFISKIASSSHFSGTPYYVRLPDGKKVPSRDWLLRKLSEIEGTFSS